jgi:hypothetical protein
MQKRVACAAALVLVLAGPLFSQKPAKGKPAPRKADGFNVREYGAKGDGKTDDTKAFQAALDAAGKAGGGIVAAPRGVYRINGNLNVPVAVTLEGVFRTATSHAGLRDKGEALPEYGTTLLAVAGEGSEEGPPFILLNGNAVLKGVLVYYPNQDPKAEPKPYPYAIAMRGNNPAVLDVELLNPYNGIDAVGAHRHLIRNIHGQPLRRGIYVDHVTDIGRIENVHWNPWWSMSEPVMKFLKTKGEAFIFGRTDWHYVLNTFCFGYAVGYRFIQTKNGACNGNFVGIGADMTHRGIVVEAAQPAGLLITNGEFVSFGEPDATEVEVLPNAGTVQFSNCSFWGPAERIAILRGGLTMFNQCNFQHWDHYKNGAAAIHAEGGRLVVSGCRFAQPLAHIYVGPNVGSAAIFGNLFAGPIRIDSRIGEQAQIALNVPDQPAAATTRPAGGAAPGPAR